MADKETTLSIVLKTVDKATAGIAAVNKRLEGITAPIKGLNKAAGEFKEHLGLILGASGIPAMGDALRGVGNAVSGLIGKLAVVGGIASLAVHGLVGLVDEFDTLGDKAEKLDVTVDFLAAMRFAAERSGASVESLDQGLTAFGENMGQLRGGTGRMLKSLQQWAPALIPMLKATKGNEAAWRLLADAMSKVTDPQKRLALALKTVGNSDLVPMLARGSEGLFELQGEFTGTAGSLEDATKKAGATDDALKNLKAATTGVKAALLTGLAPALTIIIDKMTTWLSGHREDLKRWAIDIGEKLPAAVEKVVDWIGKAWDKVSGFVDAIGGVKVALLGVAAVIVGPLIGAFASLGIALLTNPIGLIITAVAALTVGVIELVKHWDDVSDAIGRAADALANFIGVGNDEESGILGKFPIGGPGSSASDVVNKTLFNLTTAKATTEARIMVDFMNAPRGTRVTADPRNTADVDLTVGHQLAGFGP